MTVDLPNVGQQAVPTRVEWPESIHVTTLRALPAVADSARPSVRVFVLLDRGGFCGVLMEDSEEYFSPASPGKRRRTARILHDDEEEDSAELNSEARARAKVSEGKADEPAEEVNSAPSARSALRSTPGRKRLCRVNSTKQTQEVRTLRSPKTPKRSRFKELCEEVRGKISAQADKEEEEQQSSLQEDTDSEDENSFINDDDKDEDSEEARKELGKLGIHNIGEVNEIFGEYIACLTRQLHNLALDDWQQKICWTIESRLADMREKSVKSQSWNDAVKGFIPALVSRPYAKLSKLNDAVSGCAACNKIGSHSTCKLAFYGEPYEPDWVTGKQLLEAANQGANRRTWQSDDCVRCDYGDGTDETKDSGDDSANIAEPSAQWRHRREVLFAVGSWCSARVRLYHGCLHFKRQVQDQIEERLGPLIERQSREQLSDSDEEVEEDVLIENAADDLAGDGEFVGKMHEHYTTLMDQAEKYLSTMYDENNRSAPTKMHEALDSIVVGSGSEHMPGRLAEPLTAASPTMRQKTLNPTRRSRRLHSGASGKDDLGCVPRLMLSGASTLKGTPTKRFLMQTRLSAYPKARRRIAGNLLDDDGVSAGPIIDLTHDALAEAPAEEAAKPTEGEQIVQQRDSNPTPAKIVTQPHHGIPGEAVEGAHEVSAGPCALADYIRRWQLALGSALHLYTAALRQVRGNTQGISPGGLAAKQRALEAIEKLEAGVGGQRMQLNMGLFGIYEIYLELSCELERFLAAASWSLSETAEARARTIALLEDIRSKL